MSKQWQILHLSDFHLHDPDSGSMEHLRKGHFDEYLRDLAIAVREQISSPIDCVALTGDYVNQGRSRCYEHVAVIVRFLLKEFNLAESQLVICPGNHDLVRDEEVAGRLAQSRQSYNQFLAQYKLADRVESSLTGRASLYRLRDDLWALSIDSTLGATGAYIPGPGSWRGDENKDEILTWIKKYVTSPEQLLLILSHYPVEEFQGSLIPEEEEEFNSRHIWVKGKELASRIGKWRADSGTRTLWLSGDVHAEYRTMCYGIDFVTAGRLGTRIGKDSQQPRQAKIIQIASDWSRTKIFTFNYKMPGHTDRGACGNWSAETSTIPIDRKFKAKKIIIGSDRTVVGVASNGETKGVEPVPETIDVELEAQLITRIAEQCLYSVGRFETNEVDTSLAWVSVGPLLNTSGVLPVIIRTMQQWLSSQLEKQAIPHERVVLLGIDCWGAVLASQLSVVTGAQNFCVASRGSGLHYTEHERISPRVIDHIKASAATVLVHDVVGTGQSLRVIHEQIESQLNPEASSRIRWFALSVICDSARPRGENCGFLTAHGTACGALRMPILNKSQLPDQRVLTAQLRFHRPPDRVSKTK